MTELSSRTPSKIASSGIQPYPNDAMAREFNATVQNLVRSGQELESEVTRLRFSGAES